MKTFLLALTVLGSAVIGCGDNSSQCGEGTIKENGVCLPDTEGGSVCSDGTILDSETNTCVIDPNSCQDGTVLIAGACVDPGHVTANVEEGAEPNGLALLGEDSVDSAGEILAGAEGTSFVAHGKIIPFQDSDGDGQTDADVDTFTIEVTAPTLLTVTVDGVHGLAGAFFSVAAVDAGDPLSNWARAGINLTGDTSKRQLFLPAAGVYAVAITDSRTIFIGGAAQPAGDGLDLEYYATFITEPIVAQALTVTAGEASSIGTLAPGEVKFFTAQMDLGFAAAFLDTPDDEITGSLVITNLSGATTKAKAVGDEDEDLGSPAFASAVGFRAGDTTTFVADHVLNIANEDVAYELGLITNTAVELKTDGTDATAPTDPFGQNVFFYDVSAANEIDGFDIAFDIPVVAQIVDEDGNVFSNMTIDSFNDIQDTMTDYAGHFRHPAAGRYYWVTTDDTATATEVVATSTITAVTPIVVTKGTATGNIDVDQTFESNMFSYEPVIATDAWQQFTASSAGGAGAVDLRFFNPATAFGRLDDLATAGGGCSPFCDDVSPIFENTYNANGSTTIGRILLDDDTATYLVTANTVTPAGTIALNFARRAHTDIGTKNAGGTDPRTNQPLDSTTTIQRYLVRTQRDNELSLTVAPDGTLLNTVITQVNNDEGARGSPINNGITGADDTATFYQRGDGWTAWTVTFTVSVIGETFDQDLTVLGSAYAISNGATQFADACAGGGSVQAITGSSDDGITGIITAPANFSLFGAAAGSFRATTNGLLNFATGQTGTFSTNHELPSTVNPNGGGVVAPFWTDLDNIVICTKTVGTKLIVQWRGTTFDFLDNGSIEAVEFQAILDGADDTIEFVYGQNHQPDGAETNAHPGATIGIENATGTKARALGFNEAVDLSTSKKLTPVP